MSTQIHALLRLPLRLLLCLLATTYYTASYADTIGYRCTMGDSVRRIEIYYPESPETLPCQVIYHKDTEEPKTLWRAENDASYCEIQADNLIDTLKGWGWQCNPQ